MQNKPNDCSKVLQSVLNSGADTIYFPRGKWSFTDNVYIPRTVNHMIGGVEFDGNIEFIIDDGDETTAPLIFDRWMGRIGSPQLSILINHHSKRTVVVRSSEPVIILQIVMIQPLMLEPYSLKIGLQRDYIFVKDRKYLQSN